MEVRILASCVEKTSHLAARLPGACNVIAKEVQLRQRRALLVQIAWYLAGETVAADFERCERLRLKDIAQRRSDVIFASREPVEGEGAGWRARGV